MPSITSILITKNNAKHVVKALESLHFCDQKIVADSGSTDDTVAIATSKGAQVVYHDWIGFGPQKNFGLTLATGDWIFGVDADAGPQHDQRGRALGRTKQGVTATRGWRLACRV